MLRTDMSFTKEGIIFSSRYNKDILQCRFDNPISVLGIDGLARIFIGYDPGLQ